MLKQQPLEGLKLEEPLFAKQARARIGAACHLSEAPEPAGPVTNQTESNRIKPDKSDKKKRQDSARSRTLASRLIPASA
jgi:hypothetical protein